MRTREDLESYLFDSGIGHEEVAPDTWVLRHSPEAGEAIVVRLEGDLVLFRLKVLGLSLVKDRVGLFEELLRLNASDMVHASYGLADDHVVLTCMMLLGTLDSSEFQAVLDEFTLTVVNHRDALAAFCA